MSGEEKVFGEGSSDRGSSATSTSGEIAESSIVKQEGVVEQGHAVEDLNSVKTRDTKQSPLPHGTTIETTALGKPNVQEEIATTATASKTFDAPRQKTVNKLAPSRNENKSEVEAIAINDSISA
jgi:hypothetical protein